jgi:hypothetical protein
VGRQRGDYRLQPLTVCVEIGQPVPTRARLLLLSQAKPMQRLRIVSLAPLDDPKIVTTVNQDLLASLGKAGARGLVADLDPPGFLLDAILVSCLIAILVFALVMTHFPL